MEKHDIQLWKFGTAVTVSSKDGLQNIEKERIHAIAGHLKSIHEQTRKKLIIVSSGAVAAGQAILGFNKANGYTNAQKRRFSEKGWQPLIDEWKTGFGDLAERLTPSRITHHDAVSPEFWEYVHECFTHDDIILVNGNDAAAADFIDNDRLTGDIACTALQQSTTNSVEVVLGSDVAGFMIDGQVQAQITENQVTEEFLNIHCGTESGNQDTGSTGSMRSKASQAARIARVGGLVRVTDATNPENVRLIGLDGQPLGTEFIKQSA